MTDRRLPDDSERQQALDPSQSFIVEAPAGSGKTTLLVQRYLRLLSAVERPESIVAMTFTRKAAADIKGRVEDALRQAQENSPVKDCYEQRIRDLAIAALEQDRKKGWNLLSDTGRLQIQTIDSLCAMLTRQMPIVSEFGSSAQIVEDARELYHLAARQTLRDLTEGDDASKALFYRVSLHFDNDINSLEMQVARMLQQREQWRFLNQEDERDELTAAFSELLRRAHEALRIVFRQRGTVDFPEVARAAIKALGEPDQPSDLLYSLDYRIEHLLVDEFQDTSRAQYDLIDKLTGQWSEGDGRTLFLVGDPMQSIYGFREAEVSLFLDCSDNQRLGSVRLRPLRLKTNFRSTPEIVRWTESTFAPIMGENDPAHGAVKFRPSEAVRASSPVGPQLLPFIDDDGSEEAREVVRIIERAGERARDRSKVAILVRSRAQIEKILPALRNAEIRYEAIEIDELKQQQHIYDLMSLTRAVLHLGDRVSWLACLRAPWCGLTLADFSALLEHESDRTILDLLSDPNKILSLSPEGQSRAVRVQAILAAAVANAGRRSLRDLIEQTWMALGGPAILRERNQHEDADVYFNLIEAFEQGGVIRDFSLLSQHLENLYAKPATSPDCVQVMTIHQAKGLEFDTVIIPQAARGTRSSEHDLLIWTEGPQGLLIAAQPQKGDEESRYKYICEEIKKKEEHELKRLFYVACTRAKNELYVLGSVKTNHNRTACRKASHNTLLGLIWNTAQPVFESELRRKHFVQVSLDFGASTAGTKLRRLPADWRSPQFEPSVRWQPELHRATASVSEVADQYASHTRRHAGTVIHALLKRIVNDGDSLWNRERVAVMAPMIRSELLRLGVSRGDEPKASRQVIRAVTNTIESERGRWILRAHAEGRSEWAIGGRVQESLITGTVDRVFRDEEGRLWIIDFKASEHEGGAVEVFLQDQQRRYRPQLENYAALVARLARGPIWLGLYFPLLDQWREWPFEEETALAANTLGTDAD